MPTAPPPRCIECNAMITLPQPIRTNRPLFCLDPQKKCRLRYKLHEPHCARPGCRAQFTRATRADGGVMISQRYCTPAHSTGCFWCGEPVKPPGSKPENRHNPKSRRTPGRAHTEPTNLKSTNWRRNDYCSDHCRDLAWEGAPHPICPVCTKEIDHKAGQHFKDPPNIHPTCWLQKYSIAGKGRVSWNTCPERERWPQRIALINKTVLQIQKEGFPDGAVQGLRDYFRLKYTEKWPLMLSLHYVTPEDYPEALRLGLVNSIACPSESLVTQPRKPASGRPSSGPKRSPATTPATAAKKPSRKATPKAR